MFPPATRPVTRTLRDTGHHGRMDIELLSPADVTPADIDALAGILVDCVAGGASVGFLRSLDVPTARSWWLRALATPDVVTLVARRDGTIVGVVRLHPADQPNGPHRAEVAKLLVHRRSRGRGVAKALMDRLEREALDRGRTVLVLDTQTGSDAERLYAAWGWRRVGVIDDYALDPDGTPEPTTIFTKTL